MTTGTNSQHQDEAFKCKALLVDGVAISFDPTEGVGEAGKQLVLDSDGNVVMPDGGLFSLSNAVLAAAGTGQSTFAVIADQVAAVTGADGTVGVALPAAITGRSILVINTSASAALPVSPINGGNDQINALTSGTGVFTMGPGRAAWFIATSATKWYVTAHAAILATPTEIGVLAGAVAGTSAAGKALIADASFATAVGAINAATGLAVDIQKWGPLVQLTFTLTAVSIAVTDASGSGSSGSLKIFDFVQAGIQPLASRQDYTAFAEGAALTGEAGDAAFVIALGSVAANAGDGALSGTEVDFAPATGTITLSGGTATATKFGGQGAAVDGTGTAADLYLNWSGSTATIDANSTISVTGTITVLCALLGDD